MKEYQRELDASMRKRGQVNPILVRRTRQHRYRIIDGIERVESLKRIGKDTVLAYVWDKSGEREEEIHDLPISQINLNRDTVSAPLRRVPVTREDLAKALRRIIQLNPHETLADIGKRINKSVRWLKALLAENPG